MLTEKQAPGAAPPPGFIPLLIPTIQGNEWRYVKECLGTNWVSSVGPFVDRFEVRGGLELPGAERILSADPCQRALAGNVFKP